MARKTRAPKDQIESYNNDGVTKFKTDKLNSEQPYHYKENIAKQTVNLKELSIPASQNTQEVSGDGYEPFKEWNRGKATERR